MRHKKILALAIILTGCYHEAEKTEIKNAIQVELLFTQDSVKVYRFWDAGYPHYFTTRGETMTWQSDGKYHYEENIN
jgi:tRNA A37 methylthiotransferase MiaB